MGKKYITTVFSHVLGWLLLLSLPLLFLLQQPGPQSELDVLFSSSYWLFNFSLIVLFYLHMYGLYPWFYAKKKMLPYVLSLLFLFLAFLYLQPFGRLMDHTNRRQERPKEGFNRGFRPERDEFPGHRPPPLTPGTAPRPRMGPGPRAGHLDVTSAFLFFMMVAFGHALQSIYRLRQSEKRVLQAENDKTNAELSFLKAQINPHFLFNTLNNIYSLAMADSEPTANAIMRLSNIMRYVTDEVSADLVPLESELACLQDYIELQQLRLSQQVQVEYQVEGSVKGKQIPPMVLMTFAENAFKYGVSNHEPAVIAILVKASENNLAFDCLNTLFEVPRNVVSTGIGLSNIRKRLMHLYPNRHKLEITQSDGLFKVHLTLQV